MCIRDKQSTIPIAVGNAIETSVHLRLPVSFFIVRQVVEPVSYTHLDWMEIEKQRGISVTSSVLQFKYNGYCINILDTPGQEDFSEDTYRTLMAADSAVMVIDGSKGVEKQTIKLFKVCVMGACLVAYLPRQSPILRWRYLPTYPSR